MDKLGIGGNSAKTDRGNQLAGTQGNWSLFNYGLPAGEEGQKTGQGDLNAAKSTLGESTDYWRKLLTAGRTDTAERAAPAVNQVLTNETATRNAEGTFGTDRTGGTVATNREAATRSQSQIDDIINRNLMQGHEEGAQGLQTAAGLQANIGTTELHNALSLLGISQNSINAIMDNATKSRPVSQQMHDSEMSAYGQAIGSVISHFILGGG